VTTHGSFFSMAHFHYTIMGGLVFTFFARDLLLGAEDDGCELNERLGKVHFWSMFLFFNLTFAALFAVGFLGQRAAAGLSERPPVPQRLGLDLGFCLGASMLVFLFNLRLVACFREEAGGREPVGIAVDRVPAPVAGARCTTSTASPSSRRPVRVRRGADAGRRSRGRPAGRE
jgi:cytochrome c oxidase subunit 1